MGTCCNKNTRETPVDAKEEKLDAQTDDVPVEDRAGKSANLSIEDRIFLQKAKTMLSHKEEINVRDHIKKP